MKYAIYQIPSNADRETRTGFQMEIPYGLADMPTWDFAREHFELVAIVEAPSLNHVFSLTQNGWTPDNPEGKPWTESVTTLTVNRRAHDMREHGGLRSLSVGDIVRPLDEVPAPQMVAPAGYRTVPMGEKDPA